MAKANRQVKVSEGGEAGESESSAERGLSEAIQALSHLTTKQQQLISEDESTDIRNRGIIILLTSLQR